MKPSLRVFWASGCTLRSFVAVSDSFEKEP